MALRGRSPRSNLQVGRGISSRGERPARNTSANKTQAPTARATLYYFEFYLEFRNRGEHHRKDQDDREDRKEDLC
jgi:hypothetical protein